MKTSFSFLLLSIAFSWAGTADAAKYSPSSAASSSISQTALADTFYDYAVYAGEPRYRWYIVWDMGNGDTIEYGSFYTEQSATDFLVHCFFAGWEPEGYVGYEIVERELEPILAYVATHDKLADALQQAATFQTLGYYTDVRKVNHYTRVRR